MGSWELPKLGLVFSLAGIFMLAIGGMAGLPVTDAALGTFGSVAVASIGAAGVQAARKASNGSGNGQQPDPPDSGPQPQGDEG